MKSIIIILISILFSRCDGQTKVGDRNILEFEFLKRLDTLKIDTIYKIYSAQYFTVTNYFDDNETDLLVMNFIKGFKKNLSKNIDQWNISFYKESKITNTKNLLSNPRDLDRYSQENDLIYTFSGDKVTDNIFRTKYKNGVTISPKSDIHIEDIK